MKEANLAKLAELKLKLQREGTNKPIPLDRQLWPRYLRELRKSTEMAGIPFWRLFGVNDNTCYKYEQLDPDHARILPRDIMDTIAESLGLTYAETNDPEPVLKKLVGVEAEYKELIAFLYEHQITLQDLKNYVEIRRIFIR